MNILVATGHLALDTVKEAVGNAADILLVDTEIAAFITPGKLLAAFREKYTPGSFDILFIPGLTAGDFTDVSLRIGCQVYLGPKHACDLNSVIRLVDTVRFSDTVPACELIEGIRREEARKTLKELETLAEPALSLRGTKVGGNSVMKVMAEIVDASSMSGPGLSGTINHFLAEGADIIDLGIALTARTEAVEKTVGAAREVTDGPLSIDTTVAEHILCGVDGGVDLVLSLNSSNIDSVGAAIAEKNVAAVVIPDPGKGYDSLAENINQCRRIGIENIIADPVLDPAGHGIAGSICRYLRFSAEYPDIPLFFGAGNVTELFDADSTGINALLCGIAAEAGASILFTPEYSDKTQGSIRELHTAARMMLLAKHRRSSPKDLGLDLLRMKEKRKRRERELPGGAVSARAGPGWELDPLGAFRIGIAHDREGSGFIVAEHEKLTIVGKTAAEVLDTILQNRLVSRLDHAGYLGRELEKAGIALKLNRSYEQDDNF
jgi:dihydropteroate synthase-like protein